MLLLIALLLQSPIQLEISAPKSVLFLGETIPIRLSFTSTQPNAYAVSGEDPIGVLSRILIVARRKGPLIPLIRFRYLDSGTRRHDRSQCLLTRIDPDSNIQTCVRIR